jgi:phospholipid/cholesterol/gamma-HCH transport system substrate-binding protein
MRPGQHKRLPNHVIGLIMVVIIAVGSFLAYSKKLPWTHGYEIKAVFTTAENIRVKSPVRIAGVNVGVVTDVHHCTVDDPECQGATAGSGQQAAVGGPTSDQAAQGGPAGQQAAIVTMQINDEGRPIHEDATFKLRPRLFLEGNLFVDLHPGTPESPEASDDHVFPVSQSSVAVQLDQVLSTLQTNVRRNLQIFLKEFGDSLIKYHGAEGFRELYRTSPGAYKNTALVNQAFLGTQPHDLSGLVKNLDSTVRALDADESGLQNLVTNLRTVTGSFAAHDQALESAIRELPQVLAAGKPALLHLNQSFPPLRAFAREVLPGVRSTPETLDAATPFLHQVRGLVSKPELRGLTHDLRPTIPRLTKLSARTIPFLHQSRALSSCFNEVINPWSNDTVKPPPGYPAALAPSGNVYQETGYGLEGVSGESRSGDANGQYIRVEAGGGANTLVVPPGFADKVFQSNPASQTVPFFGFAEHGILNSTPSLSPGAEDSLKTPFRPDAPCERQAPPDLGSTLGGAPPQATLSSTNRSDWPAPLQTLFSHSEAYGKLYVKAQQLLGEGKTEQGDALMRKATLRWGRFEKGALPQLQSELGALGGAG